MRWLALCIVAFFVNQSLIAQLNIQEQGGFEFVNGSGLTPVADDLGRPYVYVAANEHGLYILDVSAAQPTLVQLLDTVSLGMRPMSVSQKDSLLYVCIGSHFGTSTDPPGITIINVADPQAPVVMDSWIGTSGKGTGIVKIQGDYAYIGAMSEGLVILDISNPSAISFVSQFAPPIDFPHVNNTQEKVNARGMEVVDSLVYLMYDAGGFRVINCANISQPIQIGRFANPVTYDPFDQPRAYNNVAVHDTLAYLSVDYCGLEIVSIADPTNPYLIHHYNPHGCPTGSWWDAPLHTNEIHLQPECGLAFVSTGKSEMYVIDVSDVNAPVAIDSFGTVNDTTATWGIDITETDIFLTYMNIPTWIPQFLVPFYSNWGGLKRLSYDKCAVGISEQQLEIKVFPNPVKDVLYIDGVEDELSFLITDLSGKQIIEGHSIVSQIDVSSLPAGLYMLHFSSKNQKMTQRFVKE